MAKRTPRQPVQELQQAQLRPASAPVDQMVRGLRAQPVDTGLLEGLATLSPSLGNLMQGFARQQGIKDEQAAKEGAAFAGDPAFLSENEQQRKERYAKWVAQGRIRDTDSPWFWSTASEVGARILVGRYERAVLARLDEATVVQDENGLYVPTKPIEQIQAEEWGKIAEHPNYQDYFGGREAERLRPGVNATLQDKAGAQFADNVRAFKQTAYEGQVLDIAYKAATAGDADGRFRAGIAKLGNEMYVAGVKNPAFAVATGITAALKKVHAELGPSAALHAHDLLLQTQVNGREIGTDARIADNFATMRLQLEEAEERESYRSANEKRRKREDDVDEGTTFALGVFQEAKEAGTPLEHARDSAIARAKTEFGENAPLVIKQIESLYKGAVSEGYDLAAYNDLLAAVAAGEATTDMVRGALAAGEITHEQFSKLYPQAKEKADLRKQVAENQSYKENRALLGEELRATGLKAPGQREALGALTDEFDSGVEELWPLQATDPLAFSKEVRALRTSLQARGRELESKADQERAAFLDTINQANIAKVDKSADILKAPFLSPDERAGLLQQNRLASDVSRIFNDPGVAEARAAIRSAIRANAEAAQLPEEAVEPLIAQHLAQFDDEMVVVATTEGPQWNSASYNNSLRMSARKVGASVTSALEGAVGKAARASAQSGEVLEETAKRIIKAREYEGVGSAVLATVKAPRSEFSIDLLGHGRPGDRPIFDQINRWYRQEESFLFGKVRRPDRDTIVAGIEQGDAKLLYPRDEKVDTEVILAVYKYLGVPLEALKAGAITTPGGKSIPIDPKDINPFTTPLFSSPAELEAFQGNLEAQRELGEMFRMNDKSIEKFVQAQNYLQRLLNP